MSIEWACKDAHRKTYNNLLRFKTPNDDFDMNNKCCALVSSCLCSPLTVIEGLGLLMCGLATCPTQLIGCRGKLTTHHWEKEVRCSRFEPECGCPLFPFQFEDLIDEGRMQGLSNKGLNISLNCNPVYTGPLAHTRVVSSLTPTDCIWAGALNISNVFCQVVQCPCMPVCWWLCDM